MWRLGCLDATDVPAVVASIPAGLAEDIGGDACRVDRIDELVGIVRCRARGIGDGIDEDAWSGDRSVQGRDIGDIAVGERRHERRVQPGCIGERVREDQADRRGVLGPGRLDPRERVRGEPCGGVAPQQRRSPGVVGTGTDGRGMEVELARPGGGEPERGARTPAALGLAPVKGAGVDSSGAGRRDDAIRGLLPVRAPYRVDDFAVGAVEPESARFVELAIGDLGRGTTPDDRPPRKVVVHRHVIHRQGSTTQPDDNCRVRVWIVDMECWSR